MTLRRGLALLFLFITSGSCHNAKWGWKRAETPDDVMKFLNGTAPYTRPVAEARITATWKGTYADFIVFYVPGSAGQPSGNWGWKKAVGASDAINFLNGQGYPQPVANAEIAAVQPGTIPEFYIFYQYQTTAAPTGSWGWKRA